MSLKQVTIFCDWPRCGQRLESRVYPGFLHDHRWGGPGDWLMGPHLCAEHRFRTREELDEARNAARHEAEIRDLENGM